MPLFELFNKRLKILKPEPFRIEKELQTLIEENLGEIFGFKFVETEFSTGAEHAGRIDTLALDEDNSPVIIEYKRDESPQLITQALYYLDWMQNHKEAFELLVQKKHPSVKSVNWDDIKVICVAQSYSKYDLHAVKTLGLSVELWKYTFYENKYLSLIRENSKPGVEEKSHTNRQSIEKIEYQLNDHLKKNDGNLSEVIDDLRTFILDLSDTVIENPKKLYIAYKITQNFVCMEIRKKDVILTLSLDPKSITPLPKNARDLTGKGHWGTGDLLLSIESSEDVGVAKKLIKRAFDAVGGE